MRISFEMKERDGLARICQLRTPHGVVDTPALLPVVNPNKGPISPREMKEDFGAAMVITNSYIIHKNPDLRERAIRNGVHSLIGFDGAVMTDSGSFQTYVYGDLGINEDDIVTFQRKIGADVGTILDVITPKDATRERAQADVKENIGRAHRAAALKGDMALACTVQGSVYGDLREMCAREMGIAGADVIPIGGVVPYMEAYRYEDLVEMILASKRGLDPSKPVHLFGAGHPMFFGLSVLLGCDLFDSSSYFKYAVDERLMFPDGTRRLEELGELPCACRTCSGTSAAELREMKAQGDVGEAEKTRALAMHNLHVMFSQIRVVKQAIHEGALWELVERECRAHPHLLSALQALGDEGNARFLEGHEPLSRPGAFRRTGSSSISRPTVLRIWDRLIERYRPPSGTTQHVLIPERRKPYSEGLQREIGPLGEGVHIYVDSYFGPMPIELDHMYPIAQSMTMSREGHVTANESSNRDAFVQRFIAAKGISHFIPLAEALSGEKGLPELSMMRARAVADMQFGSAATDALFDGDIKLNVTPKGKLRNVYCDGQLVLSMRAPDGLYSLKKAGAERVRTAISPPFMRVVIDDDAVPFVREGKNVMALGVTDCWDGVRPMDEVIVVDTKDSLHAVGRAMMNRKEMLAFHCGVAVKTREHA